MKISISYQPFIRNLNSVGCILVELTLSVTQFSADGCYFFVARMSCVCIFFKKNLTINLITQNYIIICYIYNTQIRIASDLL